MKVLTILAAAFVSALSADAQERPIRTKLLPVGVSGTVSGLYFRSEGQAVELKATMTGLGAGIDYEGPALLALYDDESAFSPPPPGEEPPKPLCTVRLPADADRTLLMVAKPEKGEKAPKIRAYGVSTRDLRSGDYRFFNFSPTGVAIVLGEKKFALKPGGITTVTSAEWKRDAVDLPVKLGIENEKGKLRMIYSSVWGHQPAQRNFILVFQGPSPARPLDVRRYYDIPEAEADDDRRSSETP